MGSFEPIYLTEEDIADVATFFDLDPKFCRDRIWNYDSYEMAERWEKFKPQTYREIREFYSNTDLYVWDLMQWHLSAHRDQYREIIDTITDLCPPTTHARVLEFGSGIGTDVISFIERGYSTVFADVPGVTAKFAQHRVNRRGLEAEFLPVTTDVPELPGTFDIILCFDVLEHLPNPEEILHLFSEHLAPSGVAAIKATFDDPGGYPFHLRSTIARMQNGGWQRTLNEVGFMPIRPHLYRKGSAARLAVYQARVSLSRIKQQLFNKAVLLTR